jgi:hypothetical protein
MDRRDFFKTIFAAPLLAPILLASKPSPNDELFLIADRPEIFLPKLLGKWALGHRTFLSAPHPQKEALSHTLKTSGWTPASLLELADLAISFRSLQHPAPPSFTMVKSGQIWDIRRKELFPLWQEMNEKHPPSSCLTVATLQTRQPRSKPGNTARIYMDGRVVEEIPLNKNRTKTFSTKQGRITVLIEQGEVYIPSSSCRHKICCSAPPVSISGERIVCAPNHFLLEIHGAESIDTLIG